MQRPLLMLLFTLLIAGGNANNLQAQIGAASATASASAHVIRTIVIMKNVDMNFGMLATSTSLSGSVTLSPAGVRSTGGAGGVTLPATTGTVSAASFTIMGEGNYTFSITLPASCNISDGSGNTIFGNAFTSNPSMSGVLSGTGNRTLNVGATLNLAAGQQPGSYTNASGLPVTVNYN